MRSDEDTAGSSRGRRGRRIGLASAAAAIVAACAVLAAGANPGPSGISRGWTGYVEGDLVFVGAEDIGRVTRLAVEEGDTVRRGAFLFALDSQVQEQALAAAQAAAAMAKARLDGMESARERPEQIAVLKSAEQRAVAALGLSASELDRVRQLESRGIYAKSKLDEAQSAFDRDRAALSEIRHQIEVAGLAGRQFEIDAARHAVSQAEAQVQIAEQMLSRRRRDSPTDGQVVEVYYRGGEIAPTGQPVVALLPPNNYKIVFYVPQRQFAALRIGMPVAVACAGCERVVARVTYLARQAEYTPPVIYSADERAKLVFRVIARPQPTPGLHPGEPVTVLPIGPGEGR